MKKHVYALAAVATLLAGGAFAQATDPKFNGVQPEYGSAAQIYGNSGWTVDQAYGGNGNAYGYGSALGGVLLSDGRWVPNYSAYPNYNNYSQYARTRRDRDGDGVPNNQDRYPDDPRYR